MQQSKNIGLIPPNILAEYLFFFLDTNDLCLNLFHVNKTWNKAYKWHLNVWIYILSDETKAFEVINGDIVDQIREKRLKFYEDYELEPPSKELAV